MLLHNTIETVRELEAPALVSTDWLASLSATNVRIVQTDLGDSDFRESHIPGAICWPLASLVDERYRLRTDPQAFRKLLEASGIDSQTLVVCSYAPATKALGAWLFWILQGFGHARCCVLDGGSAKWKAEGRPVSTLETQVYRVEYGRDLEAFNPANRATFEEVQVASLSGDSVQCAAILDVRTSQEFQGEWFTLSAPRAGERARRIPRATFWPCEGTFRANGTLRDKAELLAELEGLGISPQNEALIYCAVGMRAAHSWFVLKHYLGFERVRNYDGSWLDWVQHPNASVAR